MSHREYPRVAIVSANPLRDDTANGMLMRSLFSGWPRERLSQVYFQVVVPHLPNSEDCHEYRVIGTTGSGRAVRSLDADGSPATKVRESAGRSVGDRGRHRLGRALRGRRRLFPWLRAAYEIWTARPAMSRALERQLAELRPDVVYALLGGYSLTKLTAVACERLGIPLFIHVTDNFITSLYRGRPLSARLQAASEAAFRRVVRVADRLASVSPISAEEYGRRYGGSWSWFTMLIDREEYDPSPRRPDGMIRLVYAGNLALGRWQSLRAVAVGLKKLRDELEIESRLVVYCSVDELREYGGALAVPPITDLRGWVAPHELPGLLHEADVLVHVESFEPSFASYTNLSFSTKLSLYMMAGRSILAFGPSELGSVRVVRDAGAAVAVTENSAEALRDGLSRLLTDADARSLMGQRGREWAIRNVDRREGAERFRREIVAMLGRRETRRVGVPAAEPTGS
jgi:glycosyltransferase involved in cell wall biosynthesis